jgi:hypothetical protein
MKPKLDCSPLLPSSEAEAAPVAPAEEWQPIVPVPADAPQPPVLHPKRGEVSVAWRYCLADGQTAGWVCRWDTPSGKEIRPYCYCQNAAGAKEWREKALPAPRPLYRLPELARSPDKPVLIVEGEKAADAAALRFPDHAVITWAGGASTARLSHWSPLAGRKVAIWPDNDDQGRKAGQEVAALAHAARAAEVRIVGVPERFPPKWDLADQSPEWVTPDALRELLAAAPPYGAAAESSAPANDNASAAEPVTARALPFTLDQWDARACFAGPAPAERWLVQGSIPRGEPGLVVAAGDTGKGMTLLELGLRVSSGELYYGPPILGGQVVEFGNVVILAAEDSRSSIHRRLDQLDPGGARRQAAWHRLTIVPLPNAGGPFPIIVQKGHEVQYGPAVAELVAMLRKLNPALVVLDPLQPFCQADINADPTAAGFLGAMLTMLAAELGATVIAAHHMRKPAARAAVTTVSDAREAIRGTTGLVDGVRFVYAIWPEPDKATAEKACQKLGRRNDGHSIYRGAIVKANGSQARVVHQLVRDPATGLLVQQAEELTAGRSWTEEVERALVETVAACAANGHPFASSATAQAGLFTRKGRLPAPLANLGRDRLADLVTDLERAGRLVRARCGGKGAYWLDVPEGPFAKGQGTFAQGAATGTPGPRKRRAEDASAA